MPVAHADRREAERDVRPLQLAVRLDATEANGQLLGGRPLLAGAQLPDDGRALRPLLAGVEDLDAQTRVLVDAARASGETERRLAGGDARDGARRGAARRKWQRLMVGRGAEKEGVVPLDNRRVVRERPRRVG